MIFATNNSHKIEEVQAMLPSTFALETLAQCGITEDIPETADTLQGNALLKARYVWQRTGRDCFADDTGLEVEALDGAPGVRSARYAAAEGAPGHDSHANMALLLKNLEGKSNRKACFRTVIALIMGGEEYLFEGRVDGVIAEVGCGIEGFGYDPIFVAEGYDLTFAEMTLEQKNGISHRSRATQKLVEFLRVKNWGSKEK